VLDHVGLNNFSAEMHEQLEPDDWMHTTGRDNFTAAEVQLAKRCHGFHMELLRLEQTPTASHYQLIHYDVPVLDPKTHILRLHGLVEKEMYLSLAEIRSRPTLTESVLMACAGTGRTMQRKRLWAHVPWGPDSIGCAKWTGCSLADILKEAGPLPSSAQVIFTGADKGIEKGEVQYFQRSLSLEDAMRGHVLLCYQMNGEDLPPAHGAPLRLIVPGWYGMASVKWLTSIEVTAGGWWGHQMDAYSFKRTANDLHAVPLQQLPVRALMAPPGIPEFVSRTRVVSPGSIRIEGRAWAGAVDLERVEFSSDNGSTWSRAVLEAKNGLFGWAPWHFCWEAGEGTYILCCRAFDVEGRCQEEPSEEAFNWASFGSTQPQQVYVKVDKTVDSVGSHIDLTREQKAAKLSLQVESGLKAEHVQALYRAPGSQ
jgi:DMSO/TMAO reductase YedYZ molybdopterin-dependent catalytic subunit